MRIRRDRARDPHTIEMPVPARAGRSRPKHPADAAMRHTGTVRRMIVSGPRSTKRSREQL
jgi:hypothetical protein